LSEKKEELTIVKQGVSKEEFDAFAKKIEELVTPAEKTVSVSETAIEVETEDWRVKALENLKIFPNLGDGGPEVHWKYVGSKTKDEDANSIEELKAIVGEVRLGDSKEEKELKEGTIGGISGSSNAVPEIWSSKVSRGCVYPESAFWEAPFVNWVQDLYGKPGDTVNIITVGATDCVTLECAEPDATAAALSKVPCVLTEKGCPYYICKQDLEDMVPDTVDALAEAAGHCLAQCIDNYFLGQAMLTNSGTVAFSTCLTAAHIACVKGSMEAGTCTPVALIVHPVVHAALLQDSQFTSAATFGARDVITGGRVLNYLGIDILSRPKGTLVYGGSAVSGGTYYSLMLAQDAIAGAKKREITVESEYVARLRRKYFIPSARFCGTVVHDEGVWWISSIETCCG